MASIWLYATDRMLCFTWIHHPLPGFTAEEMLGKRVDELLPPADVAELLVCQQQVLANEETQQRELVLRRDQGTQFYDMTVEPLRDEHGQVIGVTGTAVEITAYKQTEAALRAMEAKYRSLFDATLDAIFIGDSNGVYLDVNPAAAEMLGFSRQQLIGTHYSTVIPPEWFPTSRDVAQSIRATGRWAGEFPMRRADGTLIWTEYRSHFDGQRVLGVARDVTARKQAAEQLRTLYDLSETINRVESLEQIYALAITALERVLQVDRASILLIDEAGIMRFCAWQGLSESYRQQAEGHSPWARTEPDPQPVLIPDVAQAELGPLQATILAEGIRAIGFIPLVEQQQLLGKFVLYYDQPHPFSAAEVQLAQTIARHVAYALQRHQVEAAMRRSAERFRSIFESNMIGIGIWDGDGSISAANDALLRLLGYTRQEVENKQLRWAQLRTPEYADLDDQAMEEARVQGFSTPYEKEYIRKDGRRVPVLVGGAWFELDGSKGVFFALDSTERKRTEQALRESNERFSKAFHASPQPMCITRAVDGAYIDVNESFARLVGWPRPELVGRTSLEIGIWTDPQVRAELTARQLQQGGNRDFEHAIRNRHGELREIISAGELLELDGQPCILSVATDITARKQAEAALRLSEEKFAKVFHAGPLIITITKLADGRLIEVNETFVRMTGYTHAEAIGRTPVELGLWVEPEQRSAGLAQLQSEHLIRNTEARFRMKDGTERTCLLSAEMIEIDGQPCAVTVLNDITERKQAEQRLQFLADVSKVLATSLDYEVTLQKVATLLVPQLADLCTVEIVGADGTIEPVAYVHIDPAQAHTVRELRRRYPPLFTTPHGIGQVIRTGRAVFHPEIRTERLLQFAYDEEHQALLRQLNFRSVIIVPLQVREQTYGALTLVWSTTERRYTEGDLHFAEEVARRAALAVDNARLYREVRVAESKLKQLNSALEQRVLERTAELERSNRELDRFAYVASHDLRSPLRGIENLVNFLREDTGDILPEPSQKHLTALRMRVKRMDTLLTDLLTYSRASRQRHPPEQVDPAALVREVVEFLAPPPGFTVSIREPMPNLMTERIPLETIFRNLISNAVKHHDHPTRGRVTIAAQAIGSFIEFTVSDNGPGIEPQFHERIFEIFQTLKPRDQMETSGIGLALVRQLVESRGGQIRVESALGQGASFCFTWPQ